MKPCLIILASLIFALPSGSYSQSVDSVQAVHPREKRPSPSIELSDLPPVTTRGDLEDFIVQQMAQRHIPGLSASIWKHGKTVWSGVFGYADFSAPAKPVEEGTLFMLASITKTVTATALMQLWEDHLFDLYDPVNNYLPFTVVHPVHGDTDISFHMLLTHTSSIRDNWGVMPYYPGDSPIPLGDYLEDYLTVGGAYYDKNNNFYQAEPGTEYHYSNIAIALAGYLVESISGVPLEPYCQEKIFKPLGMDNTSYFLANLDPRDIAMPYFWNGSNYIAYGHFGYSDYPAGQLRTSAPQLMRFLSTFMQNLYPVTSPYSGGNPGSGLPGFGKMNGTSPNLLQHGDPSPRIPRILDSETVSMMITPQVPQINPSQGLVWYKIWKSGYPLWGHNGGDQGVTTDMYYCHELETGMVVLTNGESSLSQIVNAMFDYAINR